jgi:P-loop Domain of unknown function (DUF2791)
MTAGDERNAALGLRDWPFAARPTLERGAIWAGRPEVEADINRILRAALRTPASKLVLVWAAYGAGKTHLLRHIQWLARDEPDLVTAYVDVPEGIRSFVNLYSACVKGLEDVGALASAGRDLFDRTRGNVSSNVERALLRIGAYGADDAQIASAWLRGERVSMRRLDDVGITSRIATAADAVDCLNELLRVVRRDGTRKAILLVDEVQVLEALTKAKREEALGGLRKLFDHHSDGLTLILSFTANAQATMRAIIGEALMSRAFETVTLPSLTEDEAVQFVVDLIRHWSLDPARAPAPFESDAIRGVVAAVRRQADELTPRELMKAFDRVLLDADADITEGSITTIDAQYALDHMPRSAEDGD